MRRLAYGWGLALVLLGFVGAVQADVQDPEQLVKETTARVLGELQAREADIRANPEIVNELVRDIVLPHFDFEAMGRLVLARDWRAASKEQQRRFVDEFRELLIGTYGTSLAEYSGQEVKYLPTAGNNDRRATVRSEIVQPSGPSIPLSYELRRTPEGWKVFDVVIDNVSLVQTYRSSLGADIHRRGLDAVIEGMARKNAGGAE